MNTNVNLCAFILPNMAQIWEKMHMLRQRYVTLQARAYLKMKQLEHQRTEIGKRPFVFSSD